MHTGLNHLEKFAWLGSFSGAFNNWLLTRPATRGRGFSLAEDKIPAQFPALDRSSNERIKLLWIACGTADFWALPTNQQFKKYLDSIEVKVTYVETPDMGHNWQFWRQNLADFAQLVFK